MKFSDEILHILRDLLNEVQGLGLKEPTAMTLATAAPSGRPSARVVLVKQINADGCVFYSNQQSRKGQELSANPRASLCGFWDALGKQVRIEGRVELVTEGEADAYWKTRARESQLGGLVSQQSHPMESREHLITQIAEAAKAYEGKEIARPNTWVGFRLHPEQIEFWTADPHRINTRIQYTAQQDRWVREVLYP